MRPWKQRDGAGPRERVARTKDPRFGSQNLGSNLKHPNDLIFPFDLELFYPSHPSVTSFPSVTYSGIDRIVIPCYDSEWFLATSPVAHPAPASPVPFTLIREIR